jgi:hypothetical protein
MLGLMQDIETLREIRGFILRLVDGLSPEQLEAVPPGASNSILWNLGHLAVTQQLLHYKLSGLPMYLPDEVSRMLWVLIRKLGSRQIQPQTVPD